MPRGVPPSSKHPAPSSMTPAPSSRTEATAMGRLPRGFRSGDAPTTQAPVRPTTASCIDARNAPKPRRSSLNTVLGMIAGGHQGASQASGTYPIADNENSWMLPDYSTMPSEDNYFTNLLYQEDVEVLGSDGGVESDNEFSEALHVAEMSSQTKTKGRAKNFSEEEDMLLISAYLNVSKDPIAGRDQKDGRFWERIEKYYSDNKNFESNRNWSSLRHRWTTVSKEVSLFNSYYEAIERKNESGKTINDKIADAKGTYQRLRKKAFSLFHAWNILRHEPKWATIQEHNTIEDGNIGGGLNVARPPGRKAKKDKMKAREDDESDPFIEEVKK